MGTLTSSRTTLFRTPTKGSYKMLPFQRLLRSRALFRAGPVISRNLKPQRRTHTRKWHEMGSHHPNLPRNPHLLHPRHLQLPKVLQQRGLLYHVRPTHFPESTRISGRRDLLQEPDAVDLGRDEYVARKDRYTFCG